MANKDRNRATYYVCVLTFSAHSYFSENSELTLIMVANRVDKSILERFHSNVRHFFTIVLYIVINLEPHPPLMSGSHFSVLPPYHTVWPWPMLLGRALYPSKLRQRFISSALAPLLPHTPLLPAPHTHSPASAAATNAPNWSKMRMRYHLPCT